MEEEYVRVRIVIEAEVLVIFLPTLFEKARDVAPIDGRFVFEADGR